MKREKIEGTIIMADGKVMTYEEFMAKPYVITLENNPDLLERAGLIFGNVSLSQKNHANYELCKQRKERLSEEIRELKLQLNKM